MNKNSIVHIRTKQEGFIKRHFLALVILIGVLPIAGTALVYYGYFHCKLGYSLSADHQVWGTFGDYIGGITNPIYAYLAFAGVVYALILQRDQTEMMRQHRKLEDISSMIESVSSTIHSALFEKMVAIKEKQCSVNDALLDISDLSFRLEIDPTCPVKYVYEDERTSILTPIGYHLVYIQEQLGLLVHALDIYVANGGADDIVALYRARYKRVAVMIYQIKYLLDSEVRDFFAVEVEKKKIIDVLLNAEINN